MASLTVRQRLRSRLFRTIHGRNLIYNTCWEDPRLDRTALNLSGEDRLVVITSAGCNALDYLLAGCGEVNAIDINPIQNALLELKTACLRTLDHAAFFELFGRGRSPWAREMYEDAIRRELSLPSRVYWDKHINFFAGKGWRRSFYYRGTSGLVARLLLTNARVLHRLREPIEALLDAGSVAEQREVYERSIHERLWSPWLRWFLSRTVTLSLLGVPWPQRGQIVRQYPGGVTRFIQDSVEAVCCRLPLRDNYFWRVYLQGHYTQECCPEYLKKENFLKLRSLLPRLHIHTGTVTETLPHLQPGLTRFVLLDHMDWMSSQHPDGLRDEWNAILETAAPGARAIFRSAGLRVDFLNQLHVRFRGGRRELGDLLRYDETLAGQLHERDRVHTYGSFHIADLPEGEG